MKNRFTAKRIAINAVLVALYIGLAMFSFILGGVKVTLEGLPVVICAIVFGPIDAVIVGFLGEFVNQMLTFGFTPTTLLWILPAVTRGLFLGLTVLLLKRNADTGAVLQSWRAGVVIVLCAVSGMIASCFNTLAYYVDSKMFGYYNYTLVLGVFWIRFLMGGAVSAAMGAVTLPVTMALRRARLIK